MPLPVLRKKSCVKIEQINAFVCKKYNFCYIDLSALSIATAYGKNIGILVTKVQECV